MARSKLLLDENIGLKVYEELKEMGINVQSVLLECRGCEDTKVIEMAKQHDKVIVTMDKDFGYLAYFTAPSRNHPLKAQGSQHPPLKDAPVPSS